MRKSNKQPKKVSSEKASKILKVTTNVRAGTVHSQCAICGLTGTGGGPIH